jgi:hypothetical protein
MHIIYNIEYLPDEIKSHLSKQYIKHNLIFTFECIMNLYRLLNLDQVINSGRLDLLQMREIMDNV